MRQKKFTNNSKKVSISFKRKLTIYYTRLLFFIKFSLIIFLITFFFTNLFSSIKENIKQNFYNISAELGFTLQDIIIEGQKNVPLKDIISCLNADKGAPIFAIKLNKVHSQLESNPWVRAAVVERRMPNTIYIAIYERNPIAIWQFEQKLYLIDEEGNRISSDIEKFNNLLHVVGDDANIYAQSLINVLNRYPSVLSKIISAVRYGQRRWNLNLDQQITVKLPENNLIPAYEYLISLDQKSKFFDQNYKILDLRDPSKYYIEKY